MPKTIAVIDGNSLMHRAYHAVPPSMNAPDGTPTNAVFGFMSMLIKFIESASPDAIVCAFDAGRPKFRMEALEQYKAQRPPMDDDLRVQFPLIEDILASMNIPVVKMKGWEGDDILGTVSARDEEKGFDTLLVSGDKDVYQLASGKTHVVTTKKGITDVAIYDPAQVEERYGVTPAQFPDFLGLMGDSSDNIPGVPGIGAKTAAKLLQRFGSLDGIYDNLDQLKGKQLEHIRDNKDAAYLSREVATIVRDLDFPLDLDAAAFPAYDEASVTEAFGKLNLKMHLSKILAFIGTSPVTKQVALDWKGYATGEEAVKFAAETIAKVADGGEEARLGISVAHSEQESLFGPNLKLAVASEEGCALLDGHSAQQALVRIVKGCPFSVLDAKCALQEVFPADTEKETLVDEAALFATRGFDVSLAAYDLNSSISGYTASSISETYLGGALPSGDSPDDELVIEAACARVASQPLCRALADDGTLSVYEEIDWPLLPVLVCMERTGAAIDVDHLAKLGATTQTALDGLVARIYEGAGEEFNIDSPKQVSHILFEVIGLKPKKKTSRGFSTDAKVLRELSEEHELPGLILQYRELAKIKGTYIDALPKMRKSDGRLHTSFNETVTTTGRLSSSDPNLQNIPVRTDFGRHIRECFVPLKKGQVFMSADYSQIELRLLAHLSGDEHLIEAFRSGADFHAATASRVFDVPLDQVTPQLRSRAKAVNFGIVYGQQAYGLSQSLHIGFSEAQEMIDRYFEAYPGVRTYLDEIVAQAKETGFALTMFGRKRHIPELRASNAQQRAFGERTAMNHPMQGSAADIIKKAMVETFHRLSREFPQTELMLQVHDELDLSVPEEDVTGVSALVGDVMEHVVELSVPLLVDVSSGANWALAH